MASKTVALSLTGLFVVFLVVLVVVQFLKPYRREGFASLNNIQKKMSGFTNGPVKKANNY